MEPEAGAAVMQAVIGVYLMMGLGLIFFAYRRKWWAASGIVILLFSLPLMVLLRAEAIFFTFSAAGACMIVQAWADSARKEAPKAGGTQEGVTDVKDTKPQP
jgi:hypothetical protein